nr:diaminopimelate epimerase [uncultured Neisseria sp.]
MNTLKFTKMHGLGNDFMVIDAVSQDFIPEHAPIAAWADRFRGIGFDQLLVVGRSETEGVDFRYRIFNADGSEVGQCGNGARCFARFVADKGLTDKKEICVETAKGIIFPKLSDNGMVTVNMGKPKFMPSEIPFVPESGEGDDACIYGVHLESGIQPVSCVNMGNPHAVIVVDDVECAPVRETGSLIEAHRQFPERVNVGFMQIVSRTAIRLRVFERGVGETQACGTGACAAVVAGIRLGLLDEGKTVEVVLPGGTLYIEWACGSDVMMTGPAETVFEGELTYS